MAVLSTTVIRVKPGRWNDFLKLMRTTNGVLTTAGAKSFRLVSAIAAGPVSGTVVFVWEADDWEDYGRVSQRFFDDPAGIELLMRSTTPEGPTQSWANSVYVDLPIEPSAL